MKKDRKLSEYCDKRMIAEALGCLILIPDLIVSSQLTNDDFPELFHRVIFSAVSNLYNSGVKSIDAVRIDEFLTAYPIQYKVFERHDGISYIEKITQITDKSNAEYYFTQVRKYTLLRRYIENGIDVSEYFDPEDIDSEIREKKQEKFDNSSVTDIINHFKSKQLEVASAFLFNADGEFKQAGTGGIEQLEKWEQGDSFGLGYASAYMTTAFYGIRGGNYTVRSMGTGTGKTRTMISDMAYAFTPEYYDSKLGKWCKNPNGINNCLYIGCEMELLTEVEPILWAYIADVPQKHIKTGRYAHGERERVLRAIQMLEQNKNIYMAYYPDYDFQKLDTLIEKSKLEHDIKAVFFDYIAITPQLIAEYSKAVNAKIGIREDMVLASLSDKLKTLARKYNIALETATQVNASYKTNDTRDETSVAGAKAIINKADCAYIGSYPTEKEFKQIEPIYKNNFAQKPNMVYSIYKNRGGDINHVKVWLYIDYDTMRVHDLFVTDNQYNLIEDVQKTYINCVEFNGNNTATSEGRKIVAADEVDNW